MFEKKVQKMFYKKARGPEDLPWHSVEPATILIDVVANKPGSRRALDLGCGSGVFSVFLAQHGYQVTALDFIPRALEMTRQKAAAEKVELNCVLADLLEWNSEQQFDLVLDSGCLHTIRASQIPRYKHKLLGWLASDADYVLAHWGKRHYFDWRPVGPRRRTRHDLLRLFAPQLEEKAYTQELLSGVPLPIGPKVLGQCFWFQRPATA